MNREEYVKSFHDRRIARLKLVLKMFLVDGFIASKIAGALGSSPYGVQQLLDNKELMDELFANDENKIEGLEAPEGMSYSDYIYSLVVEKKKQNHEKYLRERHEFMNKLLSNKHDTKERKNALVDLKALYSEEKSQYLLLAHIVLIYHLSL